MPADEKLEGTVQRITYRNEENLFTVAQLSTGEAKMPVTVVGKFISIYPGESFRLRGRWSTHPRYGRQFRVEEAEPVVPVTAAAIESYLGSGRIKGIGEATAAKLVQAFGTKTLQVIQEEPERLQEVQGIGPKKAAVIREGLAEQQETQNVMIFLQGHGVSPGFATRIYRHYRHDAIAIIRQNPYRLADEVTGIGFRTADHIARNLGIDTRAPERIQAGIKFRLREAVEEGHVYQPVARMVRDVASMLEVEEALVDKQLGVLLESGSLRQEELKGERAVYLPALHTMEVEVGRRLQSWQEAGNQIPASNISREIEEIEAESDIILAPQQRQAVEAALRKQFLVITGGPGTGKTTIIRVILRLFARKGWKVLLASPTGRAAKRMQEATGHEARTIHRLLEFGYDAGEGIQFRRNRENPLVADAIIVDEASMINLRLFYHLVVAIPPGARLILVGDVDQLPPIGPGQPLRDIIESGKVPVVRLTEVFRQARRSLIITNAHRINEGKFPRLNLSDGDFYLVEESAAASMAEKVVELVKERLPGYYGIDPREDIQVLSPQRRTVAGTDHLNQVLQQALNPPGPGKAEVTAGHTVFRTGDRVIQIQNNYNKLVFNGDMGRIVTIDPDTQQIVVEFIEAEGPRRVSYDRGEWDELELSYAISVHKSQGSEYPVVVMPLVWTLPTLMNRNLLYTAITRAKKLVVLVGEKRALAVYIRQTRGQQRYSGLLERLAKTVVRGRPGSGG